MCDSLSQGVFGVWQRNVLQTAIKHSQSSVGETFSTLNMEDYQDNKDEDDNYFSLLDMFICTRLDQN